MTDILAGRGGRWLLLGSLALNLALLVALLLPQLGLHRHQHDHGGGRMATPGTLRDVLPDVRFAEIRPLLRQHRPGLRAAITETRAARRAVDAELRREPFDRIAFETTLAELRQRDQATAAAAHRMLTDAIVALDAAERRALADRLWQRRGDDRERSERRQRREAERKREAAQSGEPL